VARCERLQKKACSCSENFRTKAGAQRYATELGIALFISYGSNDEFLKNYLFPQDLIDACNKMIFSINQRMLGGYDHSYHFVATFIGEYLAYHAEVLRKNQTTCPAHQPDDHAH